ncbi:LPXTG cell wall anchor domain-containing protein [Gardnerella vaginalis]|uniref:SpaH/EbpB family LPXTG-anchored major pilin n=1 Tax=Gardnerella sp. DNF01205 TaxID=2749069 RepID=UPI00157338B1|nr:LPXTG cell wall anchor domain-containing protein [Gardnerella vaginalis]NSX45098.1 LPXTG cell wall anchor domain-containing protein [Gardnerella vaginalis]
MNNFTKRCVAAFASLAMAGTLCAAGAVTVSSVAWASKPAVNTADDNTGDKPSQAVQKGDAPWALNDTDKAKTYSLTIFKWQDELDKSGKQKKSTPVPGAEFTVKKVTQIDGKDIDLTKYADWVKVANKIDGLNKGTATGITTENGNGTKKNTSGTDQGTKKGVAKFDLGIGLYQVQETTVPKGFSAAESKPFYMTIPRIEKDKDGNVVYNYAPYADPKNKDLSKSVKKTADTSKTVGAGDKISYTISAELDKMKEKPETGQTTANLSADDFNGYSVVDLAPANAFVYPTDITSVVTKVQLGTGEAPVKSDTTLPTADYTVAKDPNQIAATSTDVARDKIVVSFNDAGKAALAKAANGNAGNVVKVFVTLEFTLADSTTLGDKTVINKGGLIPSHEGKTPDVVEGKKYKEVKFSKFKIKKVSSTDQSALEGGKFVIFANKADAQACATAVKTNTDVESKCGASSPRSAFGEKTSAKDTGLTEEYSVKRDEDFYIVETAAPAGYIRNPDVVTTSATTGDVTYTFQNLPTKDKGFWFNLPKTGAAGVIIFAVIGMCFVGAGFFVYMRRRKKEEEQAKLRA